jgi:spore coat polysaccharide biosynthesis protein SpsF
MGSTRLPGKALADLGGQPMLARIVKRVAPARCLDQLVVATTRLPKDDPIESLARDLGVPCFRGEEQDCLDRYYQAATQHRADIVVRLTGDNPLVDHHFVDWVIGQYAASEPACDYADTSRSRTFPVGLSVEVFAFEALEAAWEADADPQHREHVTPFIYAHPERFRLLHLASPHNYSHLRWTVDTPQDLELVRRIYGQFEDDGFAWQDALSVVEQHPDWLDLNACVRQKPSP